MGAFEDFVYAELPLRPVMLRGATDATGDPNASALANVNGAPAGTFYLQDDVLPKPLWRKLDSGSTSWSLLSGVGATSESITLYVRSTGNDSNDGLSVGNALLTIQAALEKIPTYFSTGHDIIVDVQEEATFDGFLLEQRNLADTASLLIKPLLGAPTLASGTTTGTATAGDKYYLEDSGQSWTVNDLRGKLVKVGTDYGMVYSNTSTRIELTGKSAVNASGQDYEILEQKTTLNAAGPDSTTLIAVKNIQASNSLRWTIQDFKLDLTDTSIAYGVNCYNTVGGTIQRIYSEGVAFASYGFLFQGCDELNIFECYADTSWIGFVFQKCPSIRYFDGCFAYGNYSTGIMLGSMDYFNGERYAASGNGDDGIWVNGPFYADIDGGFFEDNGGYGIHVGELGNNQAGYYVASMGGTGTSSVDGNTLGGILVESYCQLRVTDCGGTNTGYGVNARMGSYVTVDDTCLLTGASGDATINDGASVLTWATDFGSDGDLAVNVANGVRVERRD